MHHKRSIAGLILLVIGLFTLNLSPAVAQGSNPLVKSFGPRLGSDGTIKVTGGEPHAMTTMPDGRIVIVGTKDNKFWLTRYHPDGRRDNSFGNNGQTTVSFGRNAVARAVVYHPNKRTIIAAGNASEDFAITSVLENGTVDSQFGTVTTDFDDGVDVIRDMIVQPDGKIVVGGSAQDCGIIFCSDNEFAAARYFMSGDLDSSFDGDGKITIGFGSSTDSLTTIQRQQDGKLVLIGLHQDAISGNHDIAVARLHATGRLDSSLDGDGKLTTDFIGFGRSGIVQPDGRIVVASEQGKMMRFQSNGVRNGTFGTNGKATIGDSAIFPVIESLHLLQSIDGTILAIGATKEDSNGTNHVVIAGFQGEDGQPHPGFGSRNQTNHHNGKRRRVADAILDGQGRILLLVNTDGSYILSRHNAVGQLEEGGLATFDPSGHDDRLQDMLVQPNGKIIAVGNSFDFRGTLSFLTVARFNKDGSLDTSFANQGLFLSSRSGERRNAHAVTQEANGRILVAGNFKFGTSGRRIVVHALSADGRPDSTFGNGGNGTGTAVLDIAGFSEPKAITTQSDGKIVIAGWNDSDPMVVRLDARGNLDRTFDSDGILFSDFGGGNERYNDVAVQPDGKLVLVGWAGGGPDILIERRLPNGALDPNFRQGGRFLLNDSAKFEGAMSVAVQRDNKIVVAAFNGEDTAEFMLIRLHPDGTPDQAFGEGILGNGNGFSRRQLILNSRTVPISTAAMLLEQDGSFLVVGCTVAPMKQFVTMRYTPSGQIDPNFGAFRARFALANFTTRQDCPSAVAFDPDSRETIVAGSIGMPGRAAYGFARYDTGVVIDDTPPEEPITGLSATSDGSTTVGSPTTFTASIEGGTNVEFFWEFGDGNQGEGQNVSHTYTEAGEYVATVIARNTVDKKDVQVKVAVTAETPPPDNPGNPLAVLYLSSTTAGEVDGITFRDEDLVAFDTTTQEWTFLIDGSDIGLEFVDVNAFHWQSKDSLLMSVNKPVELPDVGLVDDSDIVRFIPESWGANTAGRYEFFLRGADVGLTTANENIDAIALASDGRLVISTWGFTTVPGPDGPLSVRDEDLIVRNGDHWELFFSGATIGLGTRTEDISAAWVDARGLLLSTLGKFTIEGLSGNGDSLFRCPPPGGIDRVAPNCVLDFDGAAHGFGGERIDALSIGQTGIQGSNRSDDTGTPPTDEDTTEDDGAAELQIFLPVVMR